MPYRIIPDNDLFVKISLGNKKLLETTAMFITKELAKLNILHLYNLKLFDLEKTQMSLFSWDYHLPVLSGPS